MAKKRILIINKSFQLGGIQKALTNMLHEIHEDCDVTLAVFHPRGPFRDEIPEDVKILSLSPLVQVLGMTGADCKKYGSVGQMLFKVVGTAWAKVFGNGLPVKFALAFQKNIGEYDVVISYHQETHTNTLVTGFGAFALQKCIAPKKIAWVHADFVATKLGTEKNKKIYQKFDKIVAVSKACMNQFILAYPSLEEKCDYCYNCIPTADILRKSTEMQDVFRRGENTTILFSACRLVEEKGLIPALESLLPLWQSGEDFKWYIAGEGVEREKLEEKIRRNHLEDRVILMGFQSNPYPYLKEADFLFLPSLHETFGMVVGEAHILGTPVIASNIPVMRELMLEGDVVWNPDNSMTLKEVFRLRNFVKMDTAELPPFSECFSKIIGENRYVH